METKYTEFKHPNMMTGVSENFMLPSADLTDSSRDGTKRKKGCSYYF